MHAETCPIKSTTLRNRYFVDSCWNCRNYIPQGLDDPDDDAFCQLDGCSVMVLEWCKDWERDCG